MVELSLILLGFSFCIFVLLYALLFRGGKFYRIIIIAFAGRIVLSFLFPELIGSADVADYQPYFISFTEALQSGTIFGSLEPHGPFYTLLYPGWIYALFGADGLWLIRLANAVVSLLVIIPLNMVNKQIWNRDLATWQVMLVLFWPSYIQLSVEVGRTGISVILVLLTVSTILKSVESPCMATISASIILFSLNALMRIHYASYAIVLILSIYFYKTLITKNWEERGIIAVFGAGFIGVSLYSYSKLSYDLSLQIFNNLARSSAQGGSAYLVQLYPTSFLDLIWYMPIQAFYFLFSPLPWDILNNFGLLSVIAGTQSSILLIITSATIIKRRQTLHRDWRVFALFATILLTALGLGLVVKNAGGAVRWRLPSTLLLISITTSLLITE